MNILIINAFGKGKEAESRFNSLCRVISRSIEQVAHKSGIDAFSYVYRTPNEIDDYIYDVDFNPNEGTQSNLSHKKNLDNIDMIFIDGTERYLPWLKSGYKLSLFIKLCKTIDKVMFVAGVGMEVLVYYLASSGHNEFHFINARGEISSIEEVNKIPKSFLRSIKKNDHLLDYVTGDVLEYRHINQEWEPVLNIGLHKQILTEKYISTRGKFVLHHNNTTTTSIQSTYYNELKIKINKHYQSHWLFKGIDSEFIGYTTLTWFPHYFNVTDEKYISQILAESVKGTAVIEHNNTVGVTFHPGMSVHSIYKESGMILTNFIKRKFKALQGKILHCNYDTTHTVTNKIERHSSVPLMFKAYQLNDDIQRRKYNNQLLEKVDVLKRTSSIDKVCNSQAFSKVIKVKKEAAHCGLSINNRNKVLVEDNSINQKTITCFNSKHHHHSTKSNKHIPPPLVVEGVSNGPTTNNNEVLKPNPHARISELFTIKHNTHVHATTTTKKRNSIEEKVDYNAEDYINFIDKSRMDEDVMLTYYKKLRHDTLSKLHELAQTERERESSTLCNNRHKVKPLVLSVNSSKEGACLSTRNKSTSSVTVPNRSKNRHEHARNRRHINMNVFRRYKGVSVGSEYVTKDEIERKEFLINKSKWLTDEDFHRVFGLNTTSIKPVANVMSVIGKSVAEHHFRETTPSKWLVSKGFVV